ncbi:MAG: AAA family ATPase [Clostridiales bacterium]|nr:AAA family ATPase [Clostridiales bacterium]
MDLKERRGVIPVTKKEFYRILEQIVRKNPHLTKKVGNLAQKAAASDSDAVSDAELRDYMTAFPFLEPYIPAHPESVQSSGGRIFPVHQPFSVEIRQRMKLAEKNEHYRNWADAVKAVPDSTLPLPEVDRAFLRSAKEIWHQGIYGNEDILHAVLRHTVEYSRTGKTMPLLLVGAPGVGKTLVAKNYGKILNLPGSFLSGPSASAGRGLSGAPNVFVGAGAGLIVQSMIDHKAGNPVICIDEIDKTSAGSSRSADFQSELLSALDESNAAWYDNFLEIEVDASHIPFIFTANEEDGIAAPLLDRMEVIRMETPTLDVIRCITREFTLPKALKAYGGDRIEFGAHELDMLVDLLWTGGSHSCRAYQKAVELLVSHACLDAMESDRKVSITEKDIRQTAARCAENRQTRKIGFST